jgi:hypothetical protein
MGQQLRSRVKRQRRGRWIERKKKAAHLAAKTKPKTAPAPTPVSAPAVPATAGVPAKA